MYVRVHGPNLNDQSKGTFHVHERDCRDNSKYGPGRVLGGEDNGMIMKAESVRDIVVATYADQIAEQPEEEKAQYTEDLVNDFHFAPCCSDLPNVPRASARITHINAGSAQQHPEVPHTVFECWIGNVSGTFVKHNNVRDVTEWVKRVLIAYGPGKHIHIGIHSSSEYDTSAGYRPSQVDARENDVSN